MSYRPIFIPLHPESKRPIQKGYTQPDYQGVPFGPNVGLRTDGLLVIDCDTEAAAAAWEAEPGTATLFVQDTARGKHFFYRAVEGERQGPVVPGQIDMKTSRSGYVKVYDPDIIHRLVNGYAALPPAPMAVINRIRPPKPVYGDGEGLDVVGEGERSTKLVAIAGGLRRQGLNQDDINEALQTINTNRCSPPLDEEEVSSIAASVSRYEPARPALTLPERTRTDPPTSPRFTDVTLDGAPVKRAHWLWKGRIPTGSLVLLGGREGVGKSSIAFDLAAALTRGDLPGEYEGQPGTVLIVATEDSFPHTITPRLMAAGADLSRIIRVEPVEAGPLVVPDDMTALVEIAQRRGAKLVLLDPLMSRLGTLDTHKDSEVRRGLEPLAKFADDSGCVVLGVVHVNKTVTDDPSTSFMGSRAFTAVARSVLFTIYDPDDDTHVKRVLAHVKCNLGPLSLSIGYTIVERTVGEDNGPITASKVAWSKSEDPRSGWDLLRQTNDVKREKKTDTAADWLDRFLDEHGTTPATEVKAAADEQEITKSTLNRAANTLGVVREPDGRSGGGMTWRLPSTLPEVAGG